MRSSGLFAAGIISGVILLFCAIACGFIMRPEQGGQGADITQSPTQETPALTPVITPEPVHSTVFEAAELPDDMRTPRYYTAFGTGRTNGYAFTGADGSICYRVYGQLNIYFGQELLEHIVGFFEADSELNPVSEFVLDAENEAYGQPVRCTAAVPSASVPQGYKKKSANIYYFIGANRQKVYRVWASCGNGSAAFYPCDAKGSIAPGALAVDIKADAEDMKLGSRPLSIANAPHKYLDSVGPETLINMNYRLREDFLPEGLVSVKEYLSLAPFTLRDDPTMANPTALSAFIEMINAAYSEAGIKSYYLCNVYRPYSEQIENWSSRVKADPKYGTNPSKPVGSAYPGTSEHQTGLAFDITCLSHKTPGPGYASTWEAQWMRENSWRFGFILRYQKGKEQKTGIKFEPYHYRYVGTELAKKLYESGLCLEEYYDAAVVWSGRLS